MWNFSVMCIFIASALYFSAVLAISVHSYVHLSVMWRTAAPNTLYPFASRPAKWLVIPDIRIFLRRIWLIYKIHKNKIRKYIEIYIPCREPSNRYVSDFWKENVVHGYRQRPNSPDNVWSRHPTLKVANSSEYDTSVLRSNTQPPCRHLFNYNTKCKIFIRYIYLLSVSLIFRCCIITLYLKPHTFNLLKPTGHVMHQQFNIQQMYALPTLYLCVLYLSQNKQWLVPLTP
jgi:hypothetical protein